MLFAGKSLDFGLVGLKVDRRLRWRIMYGDTPQKPSEVRNRPSFGDKETFFINFDACFFLITAARGLGKKICVESI